VGARRSRSKAKGASVIADPGHGFAIAYGREAHDRLIAGIEAGRQLEMTTYEALHRIAELSGTLEVEQIREALTKLRERSS
jgi:hypothetical protein